MKKTVGVQYAYLKGKATDMELKSKVKAFYKGAKSGVKTGYKGAKHQFKEIKQQLKTKVHLMIFHRVILLQHMSTLLNVPGLSYPRSCLWILSIRPPSNKYLPVVSC